MPWGEMFDSVRMANIPATATIVACYRDGIYANEAECRRLFPHAWIVVITVKGLPGCLVCDCERGDLTPAQAAAWAYQEIRSGNRPTIYCSWAYRLAVNAELALYGLELGVTVDWWCADYVGHAILVSFSVSTQWEDAGPYDVSTTNGTWPQAGPVPAVQFVTPTITSSSTTAPQEDDVAYRIFTAPAPGLGVGETAIYVSDAIHIRQCLDPEDEATVVNDFGGKVLQGQRTSFHGFGDPLNPETARLMGVQWPPSPAQTPPAKVA